MGALGVATVVAGLVRAVVALGVVAGLVPAVVALGVVAVWRQLLILVYALAAGETNTLRSTSDVWGILPSLRSYVEII